MGLAGKAAVAVVLCLLLCVSVSAQSQLRITGPESAEVGEHIQLDILIPGGDFARVEFLLSSDPDQVQVLGAEPSRGWTAAFLGQKVTLTREEGAASELRLQLKLRILPAPAQTKIRVAVSDAVGYGEGKSASLGEASHEITVAEPLSSDNFLTALTIEEGTLTPAFHPDITQYSAAVPAHCSQPKVQATGADKSSVEVTQTEFDKEGTCLVTVTVTAENGSQRSYTITVTREKPEDTAPSVTVTETTGPATEATEQALSQQEKPKEEGTPGWLLVAALLAGAALGGAGAILLDQKKKKDR